MSTDFNYENMQEGNFLDEFNQKIKEVVQDIKDRKENLDKRKVKLTLILDPDLVRVETSQSVKIDLPADNTDTTIML